ncbi:DUF1844 domain-containing protein [Verrucomicrobiota bacterium]
MVDENGSIDMNKALWANLIIMLSSSAMQQLGKVVNPLTNKTEVDLQGAQMTIDMLVMLQERSKGNLDDEEERMMKDILASLQMNYVETAAEQDKEGVSSGQETSPADSGEEAPEPATPEAQEAAQPGVEAQTGPKRDPKFHKSYGE